MRVSLVTQGLKLCSPLSQVPATTVLSAACSRWTAMLDVRQHKYLCRRQIRKPILLCS